MASMRTPVGDHVLQVVPRMLVGNEVEVVMVRGEVLVSLGRLMHRDWDGDGDWEGEGDGTWLSCCDDDVP